MNRELLNALLVVGLAILVTIAGYALAAYVLVKVIKIAIQ